MGEIKKREERILISTVNSGEKRFEERERDSAQSTKRKGGLLRIYHVRKKKEGFFPLRRLIMGPEGMRSEKKRRGGEGVLHDRQKRGKEGNFAHSRKGKLNHSRPGSIGRGSPSAPGGRGNVHYFGLRREKEFKGRKKKSKPAQEKRRKRLLSAPHGLPGGKGVISCLTPKKGQKGVPR